MRQLFIAVPQGRGKDVITIAQAHAGVNLARFEADDAHGPIDLVMVHVSNDQVEGLVAELETLPQMRLTLLPTAVMALYPPPDSAPSQMTNVANRSPIEIFLAGLQSVGSWWGFLGYAAGAAVVVWIGLFTNTAYLLVAAMLIAPFAGPAMNAAIATARGDWRLLRKSVVRYGTAIATTIAVTALLTLAISPEVVTGLMIDTSTISTVAVLLPLAAGAVGAVHLMQSEQSSLVSGAAVGILIAASLAPPAGVVGMAIVLGRYDMALRSGFLLVLQLVGINLSAALMFRAFGLSATGARYRRGKGWLFPLALGATAVALAGLLNWQFDPSPSLERSSLEQTATATIQSLVQRQPQVSYLTSEVRYVQASAANSNRLMALVYVQENAGSGEAATEISQTLSAELKAELSVTLPGTTPLVDVTVLNE